MKRRQDQLKFEIRKQKLEFLVNKLKTGNWGMLLMALAFSYFFWDSVAKKIHVIWLTVSVLITIGRAFFVYPRYARTEITTKNINAWFNWFTFTLGVNGLCWAIAFPFFFVPEDPLLILVLMFTFFVLMGSATQSLASHLIGFAAFAIPLVSSIALLFYFGGEKIYTDFSVAIILFSLVTLGFARRTSQDITQLITLQLERENMVQELKTKSDIADKNRLIAEKSVEDKNRFLAAASHDLRQPLHASGLLLAALRKHISNNEGKQLHDDILSSNRALNSSFNSLLDMSKLDAGVVEINTQNISVTSLMTEMREAFTTVAEQKGLALNFNGADLAIYTDRALQERILRNLISNAIKYTNSGKVDVSWRLEEVSNLIEIIVSDSGIGIPKAAIEDIFSEYYQIENPERDRGKGFGLGLAIVKRLCELLDIDLQVDSKLGEGTIFRLKVAVGVLPKGEQRFNRVPYRTDFSNVTVLLIDDDKNVLSSMQKLLTSWDCKVLCAESADQAIDVVVSASVQPDMILTDYRLRENETGVEACEKVFEELNRALPTLIITGDTSPDRLLEVVESGYSLLHKPVEPAELRTFIQRNLAPVLSNP